MTPQQEARIRLSVVLFRDLLVEDHNSLQMPEASSLLLESSIDKVSYPNPPNSACMYLSIYH